MALRISSSMFATTNTRRDPTALVSDKRSLHEHELNKSFYFKVEEVSKEQARKNEHKMLLQCTIWSKKKKGIWMFSPSVKAI